MTSSSEPPERRPLLARVINGDYGLALTYWLLFLAGAVAFFLTGSIAAAENAWPQFTILVALSVGWTFVLLAGIQRAYKGDDPGKAIARIAMLFLLLNLSNTLATLSFIY